ncbi:MAG: serine hydrolase domain-containing protein [Bryobacteraceae bacterium]
MSRIIVVLLAIAVVGIPSGAAPGDTSMSAQVDAILSKALQSSNAPSISVAVVQGGKLVYAIASGRAALEPERKASADTRYAIGSISKQFTAAAILLETEQGKLSLDDPVSKYYPSLTRASEITVRELLSHASGYEDYAPQDYMIPAWIRPTTPDEILNGWAKKPLNFDPGTKWQYSNTNYVLAGKILEKTSGAALMPILHSHIFDPLGITTAGDCSVDKTPESAVAYTRYALGPPRPALREGPGWYFGAGELCMTPSDLAKWDIAFLEKRILNEAAYRSFTTEVKLKNGNGTHYALGLELGDLDGVPMIYHGGEVSGFLAENMVFPTKNAAVIVCSNQDGTGIISSVSREIAHLLVSAQKPARPEELAQVRSILAGLALGAIDRSLFTSNANFYFTQTALDDYRRSLAPIGPLESLTRSNESLRGGMTHRTYRAAFQRKTVNLNVYVTPEGKYEQFLVEEMFPR